MERRVRAGLTREEGRRFGLAVGGAFAVLAGLLAWRGHELPSWTCAGLAALLLVGAIAVPSKLGPVERAWMRFAELLSRVTTPIFLGLVYFGVFTLFGGVMRLFGRNPMVRGTDSDGFWVSRPPETGGRSDLQRQF